jgi:hypothetical protein
MSPPGIGAKKVQGSSETKFGITYIIQRSVALESAAVDLHIGIAGIDSSALEVACPPPEIRAKISRKFLGTGFGITYIAKTTNTVSSVTLESAVMDLHIGTNNTNSSALQVACPPPGIGAKKIQENSEI